MNLRTSVSLCLSDSRNPSIQASRLPKNTDDSLSKTSGVSKPHLQENRRENHDLACSSALVAAAIATSSSGSVRFAKPCLAPGRSCTSCSTSFLLSRMSFTFLTSCAFICRSSSPTAHEIGILMASTSSGTLMNVGCATNAASMSGSEMEERVCDECRTTRWFGSSFASVTTCLPPQQNPAVPIFKSLVSKGGGEVRRAWKYLITPASVLAMLHVIIQGSTWYRTWRKRSGLMKIVVIQDCFSKSVCVERMTEGDIARPRSVCK